MYTIVTSQKLCRGRRDRRPAFKVGYIGAVVVGVRVDAKAVAYVLDIFRAAKQTDTVSSVLTLQAILFKELTKLTHMLHIYVAVRTHAPLSSHVVDRELHCHQTEGFGALFNGYRLR